MKLASNLDEFFASYPDWRGERLHQLYDLITETSPELKQEFKWGVPVWTHNGLVCAISGFKDHVKINFFKGAFIDDTKGIFNAGLGSKEHRSIDFKEADGVDKVVIRQLVVAAIAYNQQ